jgi:hypothetical protein
MNRKFRPMREPARRDVRYGHEAGRRLLLIWVYGSKTVGKESPQTAERLMTPTAVDRGGSVYWEPTWSVGFCLLASLQAAFGCPLPRDLPQK